MSLSKENSLAERGVPPTKGRVSPTCTLTPLNRPAKDNQQTKPTFGVSHASSPTAVGGSGHNQAQLFPQTDPSPQGDYSNVDSGGRTARQQCTQSQPSKDYSGARLVRYWIWKCMLCCSDWRGRRQC
ncbi:hypothetical protein CPB83DRAFT_286824 [Crepidotus variabilis]|uniref:Uncharacterized protein n=1 Tax=Crepidotus variabilis TaxID=179855 RepID=A0A9P6EHT2_9AGAR|nr:hypothetical protein CPB83DRAFT_286824 [Crepidotus variabilis]